MVSRTVAAVLSALVVLADGQAIGQPAPPGRTAPRVARVAVEVDLEKLSPEEFERLKTATLSRDRRTAVAAARRRGITLAPGHAVRFDPKALLGRTRKAPGVSLGDFSRLVRGATPPPGAPKRRDELNRHMAVIAYRDHLLRPTPARKTGEVYVHRSASGGLYAPELNRAALTTLSADLRAPRLRRIAKPLADVNLAYARVRAGIGDVRDRKLARPERFDRLAGSLLLDVLSKQRTVLEFRLRALTAPESGQQALKDAEEAEDDRDALLTLIQDLLGKSQVTDEAQQDDLRLMPASLLDDIRAAVRVTVAILAVDPTTQEAVSLGTGFLYRGRIVTAAHLFVDERFWSEDALALDSIRVALASSEDEFAMDHTVRVKSDGAGIWPEHDLACLQVDEQTLDEVSRRLLEEAAQSPVLVNQGGPMAVGVVYGFAALKLDTSVPVPTWIPPGSILFPQRVRIPKLGGQVAALVHFVRALRNHLSGACSLTCAQDEVMEAIQDLMTAYDLPLDSVERDFRYRVGDANTLPEKSKDPEFKASRKIRCFGTDLVTRPGASGAPLFLLRPGPVILVGFHAGRVGAMGGDPAPPSLDRFTRAVPIFPLCKQVLDDHIGD